MTALAFTKMQALGNDFVMLDGVRRPLRLTPAQLRALADRHLGIGADQILVAEPADLPGADFRCRIYNADGGEVEHCGNGVRAMARFLRDQGLVRGDRCTLQTGAGAVVVDLLPGDLARVAMGRARLAPADVPFLADAAALDYAVDVDGQSVRLAVLGLGNPHAVARVASVADAPVTTLGPRIEHHARFPRRVNVGFVEVVDRHALRLRVWERGAGETLACGSGACAAAVAARRWGLVEATVTVHLPGGALTVQWDEPDGQVHLTGPAVTVFEGSINSP